LEPLVRGNLLFSDDGRLKEREPVDAPSHDVALLPTSGRSERPGDADVFASGLDDDSYLHGAKVVAGALLGLALAATLITSLFGAPNVAWTILLAVVVAGLIVVRRMPVVGRRGDWRAPTDP
jgi:hypothetical protein